jgi:peroxiredoxin
VIALRWAQPAPSISLPSAPGGRVVSLEEFKGRDVVIAFYCYDFGGI